MAPYLPSYLDDDHYAENHRQFIRDASMFLQNVRFGLEMLFIIIDKTSSVGTELMNDDRDMWLRKIHKDLTLRYIRMMASLWENGFQYIILSLLDGSVEKVDVHQMVNESFPVTDHRQPSMPTQSIVANKEYIYCYNDDHEEEFVRHCYYVKSLCVTEILLARCYTGGGHIQLDTTGEAHVRWREMISSSRMLQGLKYFFMITDLPVMGHHERMELSSMHQNQWCGDDYMDLCESIVNCFVRVWRIIYGRICGHTVPNIWRGMAITSVMEEEEDKDADVTCIEQLFVDAMALIVSDEEKSETETTYLAQQFRKKSIIDSYFRQEDDAPLFHAFEALRHYVLLIDGQQLYSLCRFDSERLLERIYCDETDQVLTQLNGILEPVWRQNKERGAAAEQQDDNFDDNSAVSRDESFYVPPMPIFIQAQESKKPVSKDFTPEHHEKKDTTDFETFEMKTMSKKKESPSPALTQRPAGDRKQLKAVGQPYGVSCPFCGHARGITMEGFKKFDVDPKEFQWEYLEGNTTTRFCRHDCQPRHHTASDGQRKNVEDIKHREMFLRMRKISAFNKMSAHIRHAHGDQMNLLPPLFQKYRVRKVQTERCKQKGSSKN